MRCEQSELAPQVLKLTSVPETVAAAGAVLTLSDASAQHHQVASHHHPAKRKRDEDDEGRPAAGASLIDGTTASAAGLSVAGQYSGVDTAELASVVPWARRRFVWEALQLQLKVRYAMPPNRRCLCQRKSDNL